MEDIPRQTLSELVGTHGRALCDDPRRCEALLRDLCGEHRREVSALVDALEEGVAADLLASQASVPQPVLLARLTKRLCDNLGLAKDIARWAVETWAIALGVISAEESHAATGKSVAGSHPARSPSSPVPSSARVSPTKGPSLYWLGAIPAVLIAIVIIVVLATSGGDEDGGRGDEAGGLPGLGSTVETPQTIVPTSTPSPTSGPTRPPAATATQPSAPTPTPPPASTQTPPPVPTPTPQPALTPTSPPLPSPTPATTPGPPPEQVLESGQDFTASVTGGETLEWTFSGQAKQLVEIRADRDPTGNAYPRIYLLNPNGEKVASADDWRERGYARLAYTLNDTGEFLVQIDGRGGSGPLTIRFDIDPVTEISSGETVAASLHLPEQLDRYRFQGTDGQLLEIRMVRDPTGSAFPKFSLYNPFGEPVLEADDWQQRGYLVRSQTLSDTGPFLLVVQAYQWNQTGGYSLELSIDSFIPFAIEGSTTGQITKPAQRDRYRFDGTIGQTIYVQIDRDPAGNVQPAFEILDPPGNKIGEGEDWQDKGTVSGEYTLEYTGSHILVVRAYAETQTGGYTVRLELR